MVTLRSVLLLLCLACAVAPIRGQDFDLNDAFDDPPHTMKPATKKPAIPNKPPPPAGDGFDLGDAIGGEDHVTKKPVPRPKPGGSGGDFGDSDLFDAAGVDPNKPHQPSDPLSTRDKRYTISKMETIQQFLELMKTSIHTLTEIVETAEQKFHDLLNYLKK